MSDSVEVCSLKRRCFQTVREHFETVGAAAILDLPALLLKELLPHLSVCQLDELQPALNLRGISTLSCWIRILHELHGPNDVGVNRLRLQEVQVLSEDQVKRYVMRRLFATVLAGGRNAVITRNNLNTASFLETAARCLDDLHLFRQADTLHSAERRPLLRLLERRIVSVHVSLTIDLTNRKSEKVLYVLHRLLDHGVATKVALRSPEALAWVLHGRGSRSENLQDTKTTLSPQTRTSQDQEDQGPPHKRPKLDPESGNVTVDPQVLCQTFGPCAGPCPRGQVPVPCPRGHIHILEVEQCHSDSIRVLSAALPSFFCLRSLSLRSEDVVFREEDVLVLAAALHRLFSSSHCVLTELNVGLVPSVGLVETLLDSSPELTALQVEVQTLTWRPRPLRPGRVAAHASELQLEKLDIRLSEPHTDLQAVTSVLRRCPRLSNVHVSGVRLPTGSSVSRLLSTLSESNQLLKSLRLEDMKLSDCVPEILRLLTGSQLEELHLNDCRLLESSSERDGRLQQLVSTLKTLPSLHTLSLAQNRLARSVCVLTELFSGPSPSAVTRLNISSNFIQPAELLEFSDRLWTHRPAHTLTLDLRLNPGDRDPDTWSSALNRLRPLCLLLVEQWDSTSTMMDHVSNM